MEKYIEQRVETLENTVAKLLEQQKITQPEKLFTIKEVAEILKVKPETVNYHIRNDALIPVPGKKRYRLISQTQLDNFLTKDTKNDN